MEKSNPLRSRFEKLKSATLQNWLPPVGPEANQLRAEATIDMGWGRIIFAHTFDDMQRLRDTILAEAPDKRDITFYLRDPHVLLSLCPEQFFLDPSHTYRLYVHNYQPCSDSWLSAKTRRLSSMEDVQGINRIYTARGMVSIDTDRPLEHFISSSRTYLVSEAPDGQGIMGTVTGVDHVEAFNDPENGASLWCLAVAPQTQCPGVGEALVRHLIEHYITRGRNYIDLSVMHDNREAIQLYEKLGFERVPVFCVKRKNPINEPLFTGPLTEDNLNPYARLITREARRRGIDVDVLDEEYNYFALKYGGRSVTCRESLSEMTSAIAMSRCDDKRLTCRVLSAAGLNVCEQHPAGRTEDNNALLQEWKRVVVKPARGEQGNGISVDIRTPKALSVAIQRAQQYSSDVIIETYVEGEDLRIIVIDDEVVAAAVRQPGFVIGNGQHTIEALIQKYNRRRQAATGGESAVPLDDETERCLAEQKMTLASVPPADQRVVLRKTANLHTGGTIHDVTDQLHPILKKAAVEAARALDIPVTGLDFIVPDVAGSDYVIIEANERPGLANHEPQPTAERFIDFLFPQTAAQNTLS